MTIPVTSTLGFLGFISLGIGVFLILAGINIFKIKQVTVVPGKKTWRVGLIFTLIGIGFLFPEILKNIEEYSTELTTTQTTIPTESTSATIFPESSTSTETAQPSSIDVPDPLGPDVLEFANSIQFNREPKGSISKIDGIWNSEWCCRDGNVWVPGTATILVSDDNWVHIVQEDNGGGQYVIKAKLLDNRLVGRYINVNTDWDTHPWVGILVDDNRIDGMWEYEGGKEWNFFRNP